jgi:hypothetical protein
MPIKPQATAIVYYPLSDLKRNEVPPDESLIHAFPYKNDPAPIHRDGIYLLRNVSERITIQVSRQILKELQSLHHFQQ